MNVVGERQLLAEEQGGFRRRREEDAENQILTLTLLGQTMTSRRRKEC